MEPQVFVVHELDSIVVIKGLCFLARILLL